MSSKVSYISNKQQLVETVKMLLNENAEADIMISGVWTKSLHEEIIELIIEKQCSKSCKVIIPKLLFKGDISLSLLRNVCKAEGQVRVNNSVTNNLLIIDKHVIILSFSSRLNNLNLLNTTFECAVIVEDEEIVSSIKKQLSESFESSVLFRM